MIELLREPHRRYNPLADEWVVVSAGRTNRPWHGSTEADGTVDVPVYDPQCYLCPNNVRANGDRNPPYAATFVFTNDFPALRPTRSTARVEDGLLRAEGVRGACRVVCYSPHHDATLGRLTPDEVRRVVDVWAAETASLGARYQWVQVFENYGEAMGASSHHPHGQIWASSALPREAVKESASQVRHRDLTGRRLLIDYCRQESCGPRVVDENEDWLVLVPFWAAWPFETLVLPRDPAGRLQDLDEERRDTLAMALGRLLTRYDHLFDVPFPYSMGWHQAPFVAEPQDHWQLHGHFYPPLLRSATVRKFMVGYELLAETQRDLTAEEAAARLRACSTARHGPVRATRSL